MRRLFTLSFLLLLPLLAHANTIASSTMEFEGTLTDNGDGSYSGIIPMIVGGAYDIYGEEGATAWFGNDPGTGPVWTSQAIGADHDAWPTWNPDTPDWYQYSLNLYVDGSDQKWAVRNHPGGTETNPWYDEAHWGAGGLIARGVPMSGLMDWTALYAAETDVGAYLPGTGTSEIPGGAAGQGGGPGAWDMDWSWGSEVVPMEYGGFDVQVSLVSGSTYHVTMTPEAPEEVWVDDDFDASTPGWGVTHFAAIQDGIDAVSGSTVNVADGVYTGPLSITSGVHIIGESEAGVIVEAATAPTGAANTFTINAAGQTVTLETMTIRHGDYGIRSSAGNVNVLHCTLYHNGWDGTPYSTPYSQAGAAADWAAYATNGGAMRIENSGGSEIGWCTVYENDRGIRFQDGANGDIHDNNVHTNLESGIYLAASSYSGTTGCTDTEVYDNSSTGNYEHGLLCIGGLGNSFTSNIVRDNWNAGMKIWSPGEVTVEGNTFDGNNLYGFNGAGNASDSKGTVSPSGADAAAGATFALLLSGNDILNGGSGSQAQADGYHMTSPLPALGFTVENNRFAGMDIDVHVYDQAGLTTVTGNSLSAAIGIDNADATLLDASANYWGATDAVTVTGMITGNVDYSPWLDGGANDLPGFSGDYSTLYVDDDSPEAGSGGQVQEGIDLVTASTVNILPGTYPGSVTIPAGIPLTLSGAGMAQTFLTGGLAISDNADGVTLEHFALSGEAVAGRVIHGGHYNNDFTMDHVLIDAEGGTYPTRCAIAGGRTTGDVTITYCEFKNVGGWSVFDCATSGWETVMGTVTFAHNYIHECDGAVAFRGDNADRIDLVLVHDNVWENINDNWNTPGAVENAWACFEAHGVEELQFHDNTMTNVNESRWGEGQGLQTWRVDEIDVYDNDFNDCWQGIWLPGLGVEPAPTGSIHDNNFIDIADFAVFATHSGGGFSSGILDARGNWWGDVTGPYHPTLNPGGLGDNVSDYVLFEPWKGMADLAVLPASGPPIKCADTVTLTVHYAPDAFSPGLRGYSVTFRPDAELSTTELDVTEGHDFDLFDVVDNGDGTITVDGAFYVGTTLDAEADLFSVVCDAVASGTANFEITDYYLRDASNDDFFAVTTDAQVEVDCDVPAAATDLAAAPGHNKVTLTWTDPTDADLVEVEVWRGIWHDGAGSYASAYPEYDDLAGDVIPTRPADRAAALASGEWVLAGTVPAGDESFVDNIPTRGIYYYELFPRDPAYNYAPPTAETDRATSYWLADVDPSPGYDGVVDAGDITQLGAAYGEGEGDTYYDNELDVGPTDDHSGFGIPLTDSYVGFEDMMIFALNYSVVSPLPAVHTGGAEPVLAWYQVDDRTWALSLAEECLDLKALRLVLEAPAGAVLNAVQGSLLDRQGQPVFFRNAADTGLDLGLALMGSGCSLSGKGELLRVSLDRPAMLGEPEIEARDSANESLDFAIEHEAPVPVSYMLARNYPNPFNPKTTIRFDLPEAQPVRLVVFDANGRRVRVLVDETRGAGFHSVSWDGRNDQGARVSSGIYFYRIDAGPLQQTVRMVLLK